MAWKQVKYCNSGLFMTETLSNDSLDLLATALKKARLEKKLSVEEVSQLTKIKKDYLEQLEDGNFSFLPISYVYACTKTYLKEMGLDGSEILENCKKDLHIPVPYNKEEIVETDCGHNEKNKPVEKHTHYLLLMTSIVLLGIGLIAGVLIGLNVSYKGHNTELPAPRLSVSAARPSVKKPVKTSAAIHLPVSVVAPAQR